MFAHAPVLAPVSAIAQTAPQDVETRRAPENVDRLAPLPDPSIRFTSQRPPANADDVSFVLTAVAVGGGTLYDDETLRAAYADDLGGEVTLTRIYEIAAEIQALYREDGYVFTRVVVPAQEIDGGGVALEIIEARIENVAVEEPDGPVGPVRALAERMLAPLVGMTNPTDAALERALLNINDIPGIVRATAVPQASAAGSRGGLDIFVNVSRDEFDGAIFADTRQTPGIGRGFIGLTGAYNSYSDAGDTTRISIYNSFAYQGFSDPNTGVEDGALDFDERNTIVVDHRRNIGADGLVLSASGLYSRTRPGDDLANIGIAGDQILLSAKARYPLIQRRSLSLHGAIGVEFFESETDVSRGAFTISDDRLRVVTLGADALRRDGLGYTTLNVAVRQGLDLLNATEDDSAERSRPDGLADFTLIKADLERLLVVNEDLSFVGRVSGQYSLDPLLASEEFAIGGLTYGRGFDPSEFTGDHGLGLSGELRYRLPQTSIAGLAINAQIYGFGEYGRIWNKTDGGPDDRDDVLSAGGGLRLDLPNDFKLGFEVAFPVDQPLQRIKPNGGDIDGPRLFLNFSKRL